MRVCGLGIEIQNLIFLGKSLDNISKVLMVSAHGRHATTISMRNAQMITESHKGS